MCIRDRAGAGLIVIGRPEEDGISLREALELFGLSMDRRKVFLVGMGPGDPGFFTEAARRAFEESQLLAGAGRMADGLRGFQKPVLREYQPERILGLLKDHPEYEMCIRDSPGGDQRDPGGVGVKGKAGDPFKGRRSLCLWPGRRGDPEPLCPWDPL